MDTSKGATMNNAPRTVEEARDYVYSNGRWWNQEGHCAYAVPEGWGVFHQCSRRNGHGVNGLYCKQHSKMVGDNQ